MRVRILNTLKLLASDARQAIVGIILASIVVGFGGALLLSKNLWIYFQSTMQLQTPLWLTIILILLCYLYLRLKFRSYNSFEVREKIKLSKMALDILICFGQLPDDRELTTNDLSQHFGYKYNQTQHAIDTLCNFDLLMTETLLGEDQIYWLSIKGRDYLAKRNFL